MRTTSRTRSPSWNASGFGYRLPAVACRLPVPRPEESAGLRGGEDCRQEAEARTVSTSRAATGSSRRERRPTRTTRTRRPCAQIVELRRGRPNDHGPVAASSAHHHQGRANPARGPAGRGCQPAWVLQRPGADGRAAHEEGRRLWGRSPSSLARPTSSRSTAAPTGLLSAMNMQDDKVLRAVHNSLWA